MVSIPFEKSSVMTFDSREFLMIELPDIDARIKAKKFVAENTGKHIAELKKYKRKRSLTANAYFWLMAGKLAAVLRITTTEIYRGYIIEIGDNFEILPVREDAVERFMGAWSANGIGFICDNLGKSKIDGYMNIRAYYGSSTYNEDQMGRLIDLLVQDCELQGIETKPDEVARLKREWAVKEQEN